MGEACEKRSTPLNVPSRNFSTLSHFLLEAKFQPGANFIGSQSVPAINFQPSLIKKKIFTLGWNWCVTQIFSTFFFLKLKIPSRGKIVCVKVHLAKKPAFFLLRRRLAHGLKTEHSRCSKIFTNGSTLL